MPQKLLQLKRNSYKVYEFVSETYNLASQSLFRGLETLLHSELSGSVYESLD